MTDETEQAIGDLDVAGCDMMSVLGLADLAFVRGVRKIYGRFTTASNVVEFRMETGGEATCVFSRYFRMLADSWQLLDAKNPSKTVKWGFFARPRAGAFDQVNPFEEIHSSPRIGFSHKQIAVSNPA